MNIILYICVRVSVCVCTSARKPPSPALWWGYVGVCGGYVVLLVGLDGLIQPWAFEFYHTLLTAISSQVGGHQRQQQATHDKGLRVP